MRRSDLDKPLAKRAVTFSDFGTPNINVTIQVIPRSKIRGSMRRIVATCALAGSLAGILLFTIGTDQARAQSRAKVVKAAVPSFGNADAITEEELQVYSYFLASDQL